MSLREDYTKFAALGVEVAVCTWCGKVKPLDAYGVDRYSKTGKRLKCKVCTNEVANDYRERYKEQILARKRERLGDEGIKEKRREGQLKTNYGLTLESFALLLEEQKGLCAICGKTLIGNGVRCHVDHNHETGRTRGILCVTCNTGLGKFKDSVEMLRVAIAYLEKD